jgi:hypothetical protein
VEVPDDLLPLDEAPLGARHETEDGGRRRHGALSRERGGGGRRDGEGGAKSERKAHGARGQGSTSFEPRLRCYGSGARRFVKLPVLRYCTRLISTRRFCARPAAVVFGATGFDGP